MGKRKTSRRAAALVLDSQPKFDLSPYLYMQFMEPLGIANGSVARLARGSNYVLFAGPAKAISPDFGANNEYKEDPPAADGGKVVIIDTDRLWGLGGSAQWVWKDFTPAAQAHLPFFSRRPRDLRETALKH